MAEAGEVKIELSLPQIMRFAYWIVLGIGALLMLLGLGGSYGWQIAGCFFGIAARILQAEYHHSKPGAA